MLRYFSQKWEEILGRHPKLKDFVDKHGSFAFNIYILLNILGYTLWHGYQKYLQNSLDYIEIAFLLHNFVLIAVILLRQRHISLDKNTFHQFIALFAFFSGMAFFGQHETTNPLLLEISMWIIIAANLLGIVTLFNLGKSFGILIAFRKVKTGGLYSLVRHPMYGTDILLRVGFIISHFNLYTCLMFILSAGAYVYRAILEEKLLQEQPEYKDYMKKVRYRFIPFIF